MLDVIDYGGGNTGSLLRALRRLGAPYRLVARGVDLGGVPVVLPGVGSFGAVMTALENRGLVAAVRRSIDRRIPFLGICVGLQVLFEGSEESPGTEGLGVVAGSVKRFRRGKVPQIGWNRVASRRADGPAPGYAYFVNSYVAVPDDEEVVLQQADYHGPFCAAVRSGPVTAYQFHPEKSGAYGHDLLRRWIDAL